MRLAHCNLHGPSTRAGISGVVDRIELKQYVTASVDWLEAGGLAMGPIKLEAAMALAHPQLYQVKLHITSNVSKSIMV